MQQRSLRRRQAHRKVNHRRQIRRTLYFMTEHKAPAPLWNGKPKTG
ncbi:hypothetical protein Fbal_0945 [Ferrimonas balearica DSM 9799]|uniref:Uncharacterized protein n=1 Tax=Ferrimonas balearica (strain DSM 9799 / CCM 4581 / KCTC 23876 / PAT) TaxID=550540 RepID=E1STM1_FERBD|nr:hypothetical protein [Ferrimonas balearica]ADN75154.1 hypothetical protein Fbal_0945 [Ferrimonas balearica DSM 9799]MBW3138050.1 hypothetical protein [Ferrimonas balearica]MBW3164383.1 hypothetical protein [Ferrimonas balearica]MBY6105128.1 hypothetical protein [Ferrimonas balearica]MBY6224978.1 hypothetical protein [Ferrimonas balearica]